MLPSPSPLLPSYFETPCVFHNTLPRALPLERKNRTSPATFPYKVRARTQDLAMPCNLHNTRLPHVQGGRSRRERIGRTTCGSKERSKERERERGRERNAGLKALFKLKFPTMNPDGWLNRAAAAHCPFPPRPDETEY